MIINKDLSSEHTDTSDKMSRSEHTKTARQDDGWVSVSTDTHPSVRQCSGEVILGEIVEKNAVIENDKIVEKNEVIHYLEGCMKRLIKANDELLHQTEVIKREKDAEKDEVRREYHLILTGLVSKCMHVKSSKNTHSEGREKALSEAIEKEHLRRRSRKKLSWLLIKKIRSRRRLSQD